MMSGRTIRHPSPGPRHKTAAKSGRAPRRSAREFFIHASVIAPVWKKKNIELFLFKRNTEIFSLLNVYFVNVVVQPFRLTLHLLTFTGANC